MNKLTQYSLEISCKRVSNRTERKKRENEREEDAFSISTEWEITVTTADRTTTPKKNKQQLLANGKTADMTTQRGYTICTSVRVCVGLFGNSQNDFNCLCLFVSLCTVYVSKLFVDVYKKC